MFYKTRAIFVAAATTTLTGCSDGVDKRLETSSTDEAYFVSLKKAVVKMSERDKEAWDWAIQDMTRDAIQEKYPNGTPRQIIRGEAKEVLDTYPSQIA
jgi:hypothetical protein